MALVPLAGSAGADPVDDVQELLSEVLCGVDVVELPLCGGKPEQDWVKRYDGPGSHIDAAAAVRVGPGGTAVYVTGHSRAGGSGSEDYATIAYSAATGEELWVARYDGPGGSTDIPHDLAISPDGATVFVTGESRSGSAVSTMDYATVAYDAATGVQLWVARYDGPGSGPDVGYGIAVGPNGSTVYVAGQSYGGSSSYDYATIAYGTLAGTELWVARHDGAGSALDIAFDVGVTPDGTTVFVTGQDRTGLSISTTDYATLAYEAATGNRIWITHYDGPGNNHDKSIALAVAPDGAAVYVTGYSYSGSTTTTPDYATVAYDAATGAEQWVARYDGVGENIDYAHGIAVSPDGSRLFVTGQSRGDIYFDYATAAYSAADGSELWSARYTGPSGGTDAANAVAVHPDGGTVYVTGNSGGDGTGFDYATVAYDAETGAEEWVVHYNGPDDGADVANALALGPEGLALYVTGESRDGSTHYDYATVRYTLPGA